MSLLMLMMIFAILFRYRCSDGSSECADWCRDETSCTIRNGSQLSKFSEKNFNVCVLKNQFLVLLMIFFTFFILIPKPIIWLNVESNLNSIVYNWSTRPIDRRLYSVIFKDPFDMKCKTFKNRLNS